MIVGMRLRAGSYRCGMGLRAGSIGLVMTEAEREVVFRALLGPVERIPDRETVKLLEEIAAGQLREIEPAIDALLAKARGDEATGARVCACAVDRLGSGDAGTDGGISRRTDLPV